MWYSWYFAHSSLGLFQCIFVVVVFKITVKLKRKLTKKSIIQLPIIVASASQKPCQPNGFNNNNTNSHTPQKRWITYYLTGTPSRRPKEPLVIPNGQYGFCSPAQHSPDKSPKRAGAHLKAAVFCMVGSPVAHKEKVVVVWKSRCWTKVVSSILNQYRDSNFGWLTPNTLLIESPDIKRRFWLDYWIIGFWNPCEMVSDDLPLHSSLRLCNVTVCIMTCWFTQLCVFEDNGTMGDYRYRFRKGIVKLSRASELPEHETCTRYG